MGDQLSGGSDEGFGEINSDNLRNLSGELERRPADGTAEIQGSARPDSLSSGLLQKQVGAGPGKKLDPQGPVITLGQEVLRFEVVKGEILRKGGGGFVRGFQASS